MENKNGHRRAMQTGSNRVRLSQRRVALALLMLLALLAVMVSPQALAAGGPSTNCSAFVVPNSHTKPSTSPMASGTTIVIDMSSCDGSGWGIVGIATPPMHGSAHLGVYSDASDYDNVYYTNDGAGATTDTFVVKDDVSNLVNVTVHIGAATSLITVAPATLPNPAVGASYSQTLSASGGTAPYTYVLQSGSLPQGLSLSGATISGTPGTRGNYTVTLKVADDAGHSTLKSYTFAIPVPDVHITNTLPNPVRGVPYSVQLQSAEGTPPYTYSIDNGPLPAGLTVSSSGLLSGIPTGNGPITFSIESRDSSVGGPYYGPNYFTVTTETPPPLSLSPGSLPAAQVGSPFSVTISASAGAPPYGYAITAGNLPAGLNLNTSSGAITGTPSAGGSFNFTITATDSNTTGATTGTHLYNLNVGSPSIAIAPASLTDGTTGTAYSQALSASGGIAPYSYAKTGGTLPTGLTLTSAGILSGNPSAVGTFNFTVSATDNSTGTGPYSQARAYTVTIASAVPIAGNVSAAVAYGSGANPITLNITGGTPTSVTVTAPPAHGTANISGTSISYQPVAGYAGADSFTYIASNTAGSSALATVNITVSDPVINVAASASLTAQLGDAYSQTFTWSGGAAPYSGYAVTGLPAGLAVSASDNDSVTVSGTPSQAGSFTINASATDTSTGNGPFIKAQNFTLQVNTPSLSMSPAPGPALQAPYAQSYSQTFAVSGGTPPYTYKLNGTLPTGMSFDASTGTLSGTPTQTGFFQPLEIKATDSSTGPTAPYEIAYLYQLHVSPDLDPSALPDAVAGAAYNQQLSTTGGIAPYTYSMNGGTSLPPGLNLAANGHITGTPTASGSFNFNIQATDSNGISGDRGYNFSVAAPPPLTMTPTPGPLNAPYAQSYSQSFSASGGVAPYSYTLTGSLPAGMSFNAGSGTLSGTPTQTGSFPVTVMVTDSSTGAGAPTSVANNYTVEVGTPAIALTPTTLPAMQVAAPFSQQLATSGGLGPYTYSVTTGALPAGLSLTTAGLLSGTPTAVASYAFTVTAEDGYSFTGAQSYNVSVSPPALVAPSLTAQVLAGKTVQVDLTSSATGGPFAGAAVVSVQPAAAGAATVRANGSGYVLDFQAGDRFSGAAQVIYTLSNAYATSAPGTVDITVTARPDPSKDAEVLGLLAAQTNATRRMARGQITNFQQRLQRLHGGAATARFNNGLSFADVHRQQQSDNWWNTVQDQDELSYMGEQAPDLSPAATPDESSHNGMGTASTGFSVWTGGVVNIGRVTSDSRIDNDFTTSGITIGVDRRMTDDLTMGVGFGYGHDVTDVGNSGSLSKADSYTVAVYGSYYPYNGLYVDGVLGYQWLSFDTRRYVTANGNRVYGSRDGQQWFASVAVGYEYLTNDWLLAPYARLDLANGRLDAFTETGDDTYALAFGEQDIDTVSGTLGLRAQWLIESDYGVWMPSLRAEYRHDFQDSTAVALRYADMLDGPVYYADVPSLARDHVMLGAGIRLQTFNNWSLRLEYRRQLDKSSDGNQSLLFSIDKEF